MKKYKTRKSSQFSTYCINDFFQLSKFFSTLKDLRFHLHFLVFDTLVLHKQKRWGNILEKASSRINLVAVAFK